MWVSALNLFNVLMQNTLASNDQPKVNIKEKMNTIKHLAPIWISMLMALVLASCSSLPTINPDLALRSSKPVQLENARGPLTNKQSKEILAKLKHSSGDTNIFEHHLSLEQAIGNTALFVGNKVDLLIDGPQTFASMLAAIDAAKDHINMETYILEPDEIGQHFVDALLAKQHAGVQVNIIYDSFGSINTPKEFFQPLIDAGANILEYNPLNPLKSRDDWDVNERDHRKLLVVDGKVAYVGGINVSSVYSRGSNGSKFGSGGSSKKAPYKSKMKEAKNEIKNESRQNGLQNNSLITEPEKTATDKAESDADIILWRDTHLIMQGPVVKEFQKLFIETWGKQKGQTLTTRDYYPQLSSIGKEVVRAIGSSPDDTFSLIYVTLLSAINSAESRIYITNAYFIPDPQLLTALKDAAARGVDVRLILPSKSDSNLVFYASRSFYNELLSGGVKIYERQDALLHSKTAIIDGVWSTVGSTNLDWRSFLHNQEINAVILGEDFGNRMQNLFEQDLNKSKQITLQDWHKRGLILRVKETAARLWARFL